MSSPSYSSLPAADNKTKPKAVIKIFSSKDRRRMKRESKEKDKVALKEEKRLERDAERKFQEAQKRRVEFEAVITSPIKRKIMGLPPLEECEVDKDGKEEGVTEADLFGDEGGDGDDHDRGEESDQEVFGSDYDEGEERDMQDEFEEQSEAQAQASYREVAALE